MNTRLHTLVALALASPLGLVVSSAAPAQAADSTRPDTVLVSAAPGGKAANDDSDRPQISGDGKWVTYDSFATNLGPTIAGTTDRIRRVYRTNIATGETDPVSVGNNGAFSNLWSSFSWPSDDGSIVAFVSDAVALASPKVATRRSVYVRNFNTGKTELISQSSTGQPANAQASRPMMSSDGRFVTFNSPASNLTPLGGNGQEQVYLRDRQEGTTTLVSVGMDNASLGNALNYRGIVSDDGRWVTWASKSTNLASGKTPTTESLYIRDMRESKTYRVSKRLDGNPAGGSRPYMTPDGVYVGFNSYDILTSGDTANTSDTFVWNRLTGVTERLGDSGAVGETDPANGDSLRVFLSDDATIALWNSFANNLVSYDYNPAGDVFLKDRSTGRIQLLSQSWYGGPANGRSYRPVLDNDATTIAYLSNARNLVKGDPSIKNQVYVVSPSTVPAGADTVAPQFSGNQPVANTTVDPSTPVQFSGTISDDRAIDRAYIQLRDRTSGQYLKPDGTWQSTAVQVPVALADRYAASTTWSFSTKLAPGKYSYQVIGWDPNKNKTTTPAVLFTASGASPDTTAPTLTVTAPTAGTTTSSPVTFTGTASDDRGVTRAYISVRDSASAKWLQADGTWGTSAVRLDATLSDPGATTTQWTLTRALPAGTYGWEAGAFDDAKNVSNKPWSRLVVSP